MTEKWGEKQESRAVSALGRVQRIERPAVTGTEIICGNCSGDGVWPRVTYATEMGTCSECDGSSYVVAELFGMEVFAMAGLGALATSAA